MPLLRDDPAPLEQDPTPHSVRGAGLERIDQALGGERAGGADGLAVNVGSGRSVTVRDLAAELGAVVGRELEPEITGESRVGDIRHCFADVQLAQETLGYAPEVELADGMAELAAWLEGQTAEDRVDDAAAELARRGLAR